jgi:hypothetical protein
VEPCYDLGVIPLFALVVVVVGIAALTRSQRKKRQTVLERIGHMLGGGTDASCTAWGPVLGITTTYRFTTRGSSSTSENWTEIEVDLPPYPLSFNIRRHGWLDRGRIERGTMVDVIVGDPVFDEAFLVEAAPADVVRRLLDEEVRTRLATYRTVELTTEAKGEQRLLRLAIRGWIEDVQEAQVAAGLPARIARQVREVYAQLEQDAPNTAGGAPYRPMIDDREARANAAKRETEVAAIELLRNERARRAKTVGVVLLIAFGLGMLAFLR